MVVYLPNYVWLRTMLKLFFVFSEYTEPGRGRRWLGMCKVAEKTLGFKGCHR